MGKTFGDRFALEGAAETVLLSVKEGEVNLMVFTAMIAVNTMRLGHDSLSIGADGVRHRPGVRQRILQH